MLNCYTLFTYLLYTQTHMQTQTHTCLWFCSTELASLGADVLDSAAGYTSLWLAVFNRSASLVTATEATSLAVLLHAAVTVSAAEQAARWVAKPYICFTADGTFTQQHKPSSSQLHKRHVIICCCIYRQTQSSSSQLHRRPSSSAAVSIDSFSAPFI